ncbi:MAG: hypothetical protein AAGH72_06285 [Verrucomicrobiota bacterium]
MNYLLNHKFPVATGFFLVMMIQNNFAHGGLLPHSHVGDAGSHIPLVILLVLTAIVSAVAGWRFFKRHR